ncbi:MAG: peptidylprolyl isomerase [Desulfobacterales bacterium]
MKYFALTFCLLTVGFAILITQPASAVETPEPNEVLATVNGAEITEKEFNVSLDFFEQRMALQNQEITDDQLSEVKKRILENMIDAELLLQAAKKEGYKLNEEAFQTQWSRVEERMKNDAEYKKHINDMNLSTGEMKEQIRRQMLIQEFVTQKFIEPVSVSEDEITSYYEANKDSFHTPEQVKAGHILIKVNPEADEKERAAAKEKIRDIQEQLKGGADFSALAQKYSQCPSKSDGGDLGFFSRGKMVKPFEDAAFKLKEGEVSDIVATNFGFHLIKVTDRKEASTMTRDEAAPKIQSFLKQQKVQENVMSFLKEHREKADISHSAEF